MATKKDIAAKKETNIKDPWTNVTTKFKCFTVLCYLPVAVIELKEIPEWFRISEKLVLINPLKSVE